MATEKPVYLADSIQKLADNAEAIEIDKSFKIYHYFCTSNNLIKQASIYKSEGDIEKAYIYLLRFCILAIEKLPLHPEYNDVKFSKYRDILKKDASEQLGELEKLKENLVKRYRMIELDKEKIIEKEQFKIKEKNRLAEEKRLKEENDRLERLELEENLELEREIQRIQNITNETEHFNKRKQDVEKKLRQTRFQRQAELLREETIRQQQLELKKQFDLEKEKENEQQLQLQLQQQKEIENEKELVKLQNQQLFELIETLPMEVDNTTLNIDSEELLKYLEKSKDDSKLTNNNQSQTNELLVDLPDFVQPKSNSLPNSPISLSTSNNQNIAIQTPPQTTNNLPSTYSGYPSFQYLQQHQQQNQHPHQQQQQYQTNQFSPPPYITSPPINNMNMNMNRPYISNQGIPQNNNFIPQYQHVQQYKSPPIVNLNQPLNNQQPMKLPTTPTPFGYNPSLLPPQYQFPPTNNNNIPKIPQPLLQQNTKSNSNSYLANIQKSPIQQTIPPIGGGANSQNVTTTNNSSSTTTQPVQSKPKANIDSPEASKKYSKLRKIIIFGELLNEFMRLAESNTRNSVETCGILSGTLSNDVFKVTTLIVPKQEGTSDTCNTIDEHEIFEYQLENDLLTLGWIHTHPTQDCFLSAVDVHTHCSYQYLLPEAVAIVMSPKANPNFGIFRLTDPPGIQTVQKCKLKSFHPHPPVNGIPIYNKADHIDLVWGKNEHKSVDLRKKK